MGYRSQVVLAISKELIPFLILATSKNKEAEALVFKETDKFDRNYENDKSWLLMWDGIKWYEGYHDVDVFNRLMEMLDAQGLEDLYGFIRIGEETDDIEQRGAPYEFDLYVNRSIEI